MPQRVNVQLSVAQRLQIVGQVGIVGNDGDGQSLRGLNVQGLPDGALVYVRNSTRLYKLKKNLASDVVQDVSGNDNVINSVGSSAVNGRWVALNQFAVVTIAPGGEGQGSFGTTAGFDLSDGGHFTCTYDSLPSGTPGSLWAEVVDNVTVRVHSTSATDSSNIFVVFTPDPESE